MSHRLKPSAALLLPLVGGSFMISAQTFCCSNSWLSSVRVPDEVAVEGSEVLELLAVEGPEDEVAVEGPVLDVVEAIVADVLALFLGGCGGRVLNSSSSRANIKLYTVA